MRRNTFTALMAVGVLLAVGYAAGSLVPKTLFTHPVQTYRLMRTLPLGAIVVPVQTLEARDLFERLGWGDEPGIVVNYEAPFSDSGEVICHVRTQMGTGKILPISPDWIELRRDAPRAH